MKVYQILLLILIAFFIAGKYGYIHPVTGTGTMAISDWPDKVIKEGITIGDTKIPYALVGLAVIVVFIFLLKPRASGPISGTKETLVREVEFQKMVK